MNLTIIAAAVSAALAGSVGFGAAWTLQGRSIDALKLEAKDERIAQQRAARAAIERATENVRKAQESASNRIAALNRELAAVGTERDRLRDSSAAAVRTAADSPAACASIVAAYRDILAESSGFIQEMARDADECSVERQALSDAWPK